MIDSSEKTYEGTRPCNGWHSFLNLKTPDNIAMMQLAGTGGNLYFRGKQAAGVTMAGTNWVKIRDSANWGVSLFDNSSGTTGTVPLSESAANFSYLEVFFNYGERDSIKIENPDGKSFTMTISQWVDNRKRTFISNASISGAYIGRGEHHFVDSDGYSQEYTGIYITKVIGYR